MGQTMSSGKADAIQTNSSDSSSRTSTEDPMPGLELHPSASHSLSLSNINQPSKFPNKNEVLTSSLTKSSSMQELDISDTPFMSALPRSEHGTTTDQAAKLTDFNSHLSGNSRTATQVPATDQLPFEVPEIVTEEHIKQLEDMIASRKAAYKETWETKLGKGVYIPAANETPAMGLQMLMEINEIHESTVRRIPKETFAAMPKHAKIRNSGLRRCWFVGLTLAEAFPADVARRYADRVCELLTFHSFEEAMTLLEESDIE